LLKFRGCVEGPCAGQNHNPLAAIQNVGGVLEIRLRRYVSRIRLGRRRVMNGISLGAILGDALHLHIDGDGDVHNASSAQRRSNGKIG